MIKDNKKFITLALSSALLLGATQTSSAIRSQEESDERTALEEEAGKEKCAGRIVAGLNDCPTSMHACAGLADEDLDPEEFIFLPKGTCEKIAGAHIIQDKQKKKKVAKSTEAKTSS